MHSTVETHYPHNVSFIGEQRINALEWEESIEAVGGVVRITSQNEDYFADRLRSEQDADSYLTSAAYYLFTGRDGLWVYEEKGAFIPFCWHPNSTGQVLVFPARGEISSDVLASFLKKLPAPPAGLRIARVKQDGAAVVCDGVDCSFVPVIENILDWKYPVRVLSTHTVAAMNGPDFRYIRNHVKNIKAKGASVVDIKSVSKHLLEDFISDWAGEHSSSNEDRQAMERLYQKLLSFADRPELNVDGFIILIGGNVEAISLWDVSNDSAPTANRFVNLCNYGKRGLADFSTQILAERLSMQGIEYLNVGGAETESLDVFKKKFMPAYSIGLCSVDVVLDTGINASLTPNWPNSAAALIRLSPRQFRPD